MLGIPVKFPLSTYIQMVEISILPRGLFYLVHQNINSAIYRFSTAVVLGLKFFIL